MHDTAATLPKDFWLNSGGTINLAGSAGQIEIFVDAPRAWPAGVALIAHPQPLLGGSAGHKIPHLLARAARDAGWLAMRPNFRGVGHSEGRHDHGLGESEDMMLISGLLQRSFPELPLYLAGFSFGAFVQACTASRLSEQGQAAAATLLLGLPCGRVESGRHYAPPAATPATTVLHGENDVQAPLTGVFEWARAQHQPVMVFPGTDHFFTGQLIRVRDIFQQQLRQVTRQAAASELSSIQTRAR